MPKPCSSEGLPYRKKELKMIDSRLDWCQTGAVVNELLQRPGEPYKLRRIDAVRQIHPDRSNRRAVADSKSHRVNHVIEVLQIALMHTEGNFIEARIDVAEIVKEHASHIVADHRKTKLGLMEEE